MINYRAYFRRTGILLLLIFPLFLVSCAGERIAGSYSCKAADTGETYTFTIDGQVRVEITLGGTVMVDYSGTYRIKDGTIEFSFPKDKEGIYTGKHDFRFAEDGNIEIDGTKYQKS